MSKLTLDDAIKHCLEVAEARETEVLKYNYCRGIPDVEKVVSDCKECAADHRQLAEWLTDYKELKNSIGAVNLELLKEAQAELEKRGNMLHDAIGELEEAKRLLKAVVEDSSAEPAESICAFCKNNDLVDGCRYADVCEDDNHYVWRYAAEALKLLKE